MKKKISLMAVMFLAIVIMAFRGSVTITGTVTDENSNPVTGVSIIIKGTAIGTLTGQDGRYSITSVNEIRNLVFSCPGYKTVDVPVGKRNVINVSLKPGGNSLPEIVSDNYSIPSEHGHKSEKMLISASVKGSPGIPAFRRYSGNFNTEAYAPVNENVFRYVKANPLSTFSIDVDHASYSNIRRFINNGELPPADAVRIEEMINYFRYNYPQSFGTHPFSVSTEMAVCPWNRNHYLMQVGLRAKDIEKTGFPPSNIVFLIDVSGSMNAPNKLPLLKSAFGLLVNELRPQDRVAIVVYAGAAGLVLESTPGNRKEKILAALDNLEAGGSTAGGAGLKLAYREAERNFIEGANNRIILATDGDFNIGESSNGAMERLVEDERDKGVFITVLGFGMGNLKDDKM
ncbi:MAG TPA: von Willebrand factor type A domain-containing protein, partial [Bacteroidales bacterium]|nr:von Willebrand factor type A domain-containing protein [Bacteroidales bacterium]